MEALGRDPRDWGSWDRVYFLARRRVRKKGEEDSMRPKAAGGDSQAWESQ